MRCLLLVALLSSSTLFCAEEEAQVQKKPVYQELKEPFNSMSVEEQKETGIAKLTSIEQSALIRWLEGDTAKKEESNNDAQEVTITEIQEGGKVVFFSDGMKLTFDLAGRKKTKNWEVGDKIGIGGTGRRGALNVYHLATGAKVKGHRDQAPTEEVTLARKK
jgi:hypothetical protein